MGALAIGAGQREQAQQTGGFSIPQMPTSRAAYEKPQSVILPLVLGLLFLACAVVGMVLFKKSPPAVDFKLRQGFAVGDADAYTGLAFVRSWEILAPKDRASLSGPLRAPQVAYPGNGFSLADRFAQTDYCAEFKSKLAASPVRWQERLYINNARECSGELNAAAALDDKVHNSLFVLTRKANTGATALVRLKLVLNEALSEPRYKSEFQTVAHATLRSIFGADTADIDRRLADLEPFSIKRKGISIGFSEEVLLPGAYNLIIQADCGTFGCPLLNRFYNLSRVETSPDQEVFPVLVDSGLRRTLP